MTGVDQCLLAALEDGLALEERPYAHLAERLGLDEAAVFARLTALQADGTISRFGVVVRHHELGYRANAMVVWNVPDSETQAAAARLTALPFVTLCYRRPRRPPTWPYNLFCMIHGRERAEVLDQIERASRHAGLEARPRAVLFSRRRFKQRGARYGGPAAAGYGEAAE